MDGVKSTKFIIAKVASLWIGNELGIVIAKIISSDRFASPFMRPVPISVLAHEVKIVPKDRIGDQQSNFIHSFWRGNVFSNRPENISVVISITVFCKISFAALHNFIDLKA